MRRGVKVLLTVGIAILWLFVAAMFRLAWVGQSVRGEIAFGTRVGQIIMAFSNIRVAALVVGIIGLVVQVLLILLMVFGIRKVWRIGRVSKHTEAEQQGTPKS